MSNLVSPKDAAKAIGVSRSHLYRLKKAGELEFRYFGGKVLIDLDEVHAKIMLSTSKTTKHK